MGSLVTSLFEPLLFVCHVREISCLEIPHRPGASFNRPNKCDVLPGERAVEKLAGSPLPFFDGRHVTGVSRKLRIRERDSAE